MFDIGWSEVLVVGIVALIVVGPKELPTLLRTVGRYVGLIKRQAAEFRAQFDEAMRESELAQLKKDVEGIKSEAESTLRDVERSVETEMADARNEFDQAAKGVHGYDPAAHDANGLAFPVDDVGTLPPVETAPVASGPGAAAIAAAAAAVAPPMAAPTGEAAKADPAKAGA